MTRRNEKPEIAKRLVIFSDICSSTAIVEDLKASDNLNNWLNLLIMIKENLINWGAKIGLEMYKFVGDGWILLGPHDIPRNDLFDFLDTFFASSTWGWTARISTTSWREGRIRWALLSGSTAATL